MRKKRRSKKLPNKKFPIRVVAIVFLLLVAVGAIFYALNKNDENPPQEPTPHVEKVQEEPVVLVSEQPVRLGIAKIGIADAPIEPVGIAADGAMDAPATLHGIGWYNQSAKVGEDDYAILLDGHYGTDAQPGVFYRLGELVKGDMIEVVGEKNTRLMYEVVETDRAPLEAVDMRKALMPYQDGTQSLTIITCEGIFDEARQTYDQRLVVTAVRKE